MPGSKRASPTLMSEAVITEIVGRMPYASNATLLAKTSDGGLVVYKPDDGERPLWDFPQGTLASREALTWEVSEAMGFDVIPRTVIVEGPYGRGSAQAFINENTTVDPRTLLADGPLDELWPFAVLDLVINNADRKLGHIIIEEGSGALWGIDNGLSFHHEDKLRTILWGFAGRPLPSGMADHLERLMLALHGGLSHRVADLLDVPSAQALERRTRQLLDTGVHPEPPDHRPAVPWPMW